MPLQPGARGGLPSLHGGLTVPIRARTRRGSSSWDAGSWVEELSKQARPRQVGRILCTGFDLRF